MELFSARWNKRRRVGDLIVLGFVLVQFLDGALTYFGMIAWGPSIEANPLVRSAVAIAGPGTGLAATKLLAIGFGIVLHLNRVHHLVAALTAIYLAAAILPWTAIFLAQ